MLYLYCCLPQRLKRHSYRCLLLFPAAQNAQPSFYCDTPCPPGLLYWFLPQRIRRAYNDKGFSVTADGGALRRSGTARLIPSRIAMRRSWGCGFRCRRAPYPPLFPRRIPRPAPLPFPACLISHGCCRTQPRASFSINIYFLQTAWLDSLQAVCVCFKACAVRRINSSPGAFLSVFETSTISW